MLIQLIIDAGLPVYSLCNLTAHGGEVSGNNGDILQAATVDWKGIDTTANNVLDLERILGTHWEHLH